MDQALRLLARSDVTTVPLAGGTSLIPARNSSIQAVVDLQALNLDRVDLKDGTLLLGAMVRLQMLIDHPAISAFAYGVLAEAARRSANRNIRSAATIGGTVATADPQDELYLILLTLDARVTRVTLAGEAEFSLTTLPPGGLITRITLPALAEGTGVAMSRVARTPSDRPIVAAAARMSLDNGVVRDVRLSLLSVADRPMPLAEVKATLTGRAIDAVAIEEAASIVPSLVSPPADFRGSTEYRREVAAVAARRALQAAWEQAQHPSHAPNGRIPQVEPGRPVPSLSLVGEGEIELTVNGKRQRWHAKPGETLLEVLRRECYFGVKEGCQDGSCGFCTVLLDGVAVNSCTLLAVQAAGHEITTIEGLAEYAPEEPSGYRLHPLQRAFVEHGAIQCGYCTPGMILAAKALLDTNPKPTEVDVRDALSAIYCRCTGYQKPVEAILSVVYENAR